MAISAVLAGALATGSPDPGRGFPSICWVTGLGKAVNVTALNLAKSFR